MSLTFQQALASNSRATIPAFNNEQPSRSSAAKRLANITTTTSATQAGPRSRQLNSPTLRRLKRALGNPSRCSLCIVYHECLQTSALRGMFFLLVLFLCFHNHLWAELENSSGWGL